MDIVKIDFSQKKGQPKPLHAVNNGPVYKFAEDQRITNLDAFVDAGIPYARNHDAAFFATYGGEHCVDVNFIFTNFDADPYDPNSYDFVLTDEYIKVCEHANVRTFYRLGSKIEHWKKKYNTIMPKDFNKWAIICEHIIMHYTEGWANGFRYDIEYWEIWNEPDLDADDSTNKRNWSGTANDFYELYRITLSHLKSRFPHLKIGGPAVASASPRHSDWIRGLFSRLETKPDFFSWHIYANSPQKIVERIRYVRELLNELGQDKCESILNEWNYVKGWVGDEWLYSLRTEKSLKGSSFIAATMLASVYEPLDMLMFYDARPCGMNSMFNTDFVCDKLKGYYPFYMYNALYKQQNIVEAKSDSPTLYVAAASGQEQNVMLTYFDDEDDSASSSREVKIEFSNVKNNSRVKVEYYVLDNDNDCKLIREEIFTSNDFSSYITVSLYSTHLIKIVNL